MALEVENGERIIYRKQAQVFRSSFADVMFLRVSLPDKYEMHYYALNVPD